MTALIALTAMAFTVQAPAPSVNLILEKESGFAGVPVRGKILVEFAPGLHAYQNPPSQDYQIPVSVSAGTAKVSGIDYPAGEAHVVGGETAESFTYSGKIEIPVVIWPTGKSGSQSVEVRVRYQQCNETMCFPPSTATAKANFVIESGALSATHRSVAALKALAGIE